MSSPRIVPASEAEWHAWDVYLAGALKGGLQWSAAIEQAEQCLRHRREMVEAAKGVRPAEELRTTIVRQLRAWAKEALDQPNAQRDQPGLGERSKALNHAADAIERGK